MSSQIIQEYPHQDITITDQELNKIELELNKHNFTIFKKKKAFRLGKGAFKTVLLGFDIKDCSKTYAIKVVNTQDGVTELKQEYQNSKYVTQSYRIIGNTCLVEITNSLAFMISQLLCENNLLEESMKTKKINQQQIIKYMIDMLIGAKELSDKGMFHLDIKPTNVMIKDGACYLIDFSSDLKKNMIVETPQYSPKLLNPEEFQNSKHDIYSIGVTLLELLKIRSSSFINDRYFQDFKTDLSTLLCVIRYSMTIGNFGLRYSLVELLEFVITTFSKYYSFKSYEEHILAYLKNESVSGQERAQKYLELYLLQGNKIDDFYLKKALQIMIEVNMVQSYEWAFTILEMAKFQLNNHKFDQCFSYLHQIFDLIFALKKDHLILFFNYLLVLGDLYYNQRQFDLAYQIYSKAFYYAYDVIIDEYNPISIKLLIKYKYAELEKYSKSSISTLRNLDVDKYDSYHSKESEIPDRNTVLLLEYKAKLMQKQKKFPEASIYLQDAFKVIQKIYPQESLEIAHSYFLISNNEILSNNYQNALNYSQLCFQIREKILNPDHILMIEIQNQIAKCLIFLNQISEAEDILNNILNKKQDNQLTNDEQTTLTYQLLICLYSMKADQTNVIYYGNLIHQINEIKNEIKGQNYEILVNKVKEIDFKKDYQILSNNESNQDSELRRENNSNCQDLKKENELLQNEVQENDQRNISTKQMGGESCKLLHIDHSSVQCNNKQPLLIQTEQTIELIQSETSSEKCQILKSSIYHNQLLQNQYLNYTFLKKKNQLNTSQDNFLFYTNQCEYLKDKQEQQIVQFDQVNINQIYNFIQEYWIILQFLIDYHLQIPAKKKFSCYQEWIYQNNCNSQNYFDTYYLDQEQQLYINQLITQFSDNYQRFSQLLQIIQQILTQYQLNLLDQINQHQQNQQNEITQLINHNNSNTTNMKQGLSSMKIVKYQLKITVKSKKPVLIKPHYFSYDSKKKIKIEKNSCPQHQNLPYCKLTIPNNHLIQTQEYLHNRFNSQIGNNQQKQNEFNKHQKKKFLKNIRISNQQFQFKKLRILITNGQCISQKTNQNLNKQICFLINKIAIIIQNSLFREINGNLQKLQNTNLPQQFKIDQQKQILQKSTNFITKRNDIFQKHSSQSNYVDESNGNLIIRTSLNDLQAINLQDYGNSNEYNETCLFTEGSTLQAIYFFSAFTRESQINQMIHNLQVTAEQQDNQDSEGNEEEDKQQNEGISEQSSDQQNNLNQTQNNQSERQQELARNTSNNSPQQDIQQFNNLDPSRIQSSHINNLNQQIIGRQSLDTNDLTNHYYKIKLIQIDKLIKQFELEENQESEREFSQQYEILVSMQHSFSSETPIIIRQNQEFRFNTIFLEFSCFPQIFKFDFTLSQLFYLKNQNNRVVLVDPYNLSVSFFLNKYTLDIQLQNGEVYPSDIEAARLYGYIQTQEDFQNQFANLICGNRFKLILEDIFIQRQINNDQFNTLRMLIDSGQHINPQVDQNQQTKESQVGDNDYNLLIQKRIDNQNQLYFEKLSRIKQSQLISFNNIFSELNQNQFTKLQMDHQLLGFYIQNLLQQIYIGDFYQDKGQRQVNKNQQHHLPNLITSKRLDLKQEDIFINGKAIYILLNELYTSINNYHLINPQVDHDQNILAAKFFLELIFNRSQYDIDQRAIEDHDLLEHFKGFQLKRSIYSYINQVLYLFNQYNRFQLGQQQINLGDYQQIIEEPYGDIRQFFVFSNKPKIKVQIQQQEPTQELQSQKDFDDIQEIEHSYFDYQESQFSFYPIFHIIDTNCVSNKVSSIFEGQDNMQQDIGPFQVNSYVVGKLNQHINNDQNDNEYQYYNFQGTCNSFYEQNRVNILQIEEIESYLDHSQKSSDADDTDLSQIIVDIKQNDLIIQVQEQFIHKDCYQQLDYQNFNQSNDQYQISFQIKSSNQDIISYSEKNVKLPEDDQLEENIIIQNSQNNNLNQFNQNYQQQEYIQNDKITEQINSTITDFWVENHGSFYRD